MNFSDKLRLLADKVNGSILFKQKIWDGRTVGDWDKFWSSYHALRDAQEAIDQWKKVISPQRLEMYGLLQALYVQQDAFRHAQESLGVDPIHIKNDFPDLLNIRLARAQLVGHPSQTLLDHKSSSYEKGTRVHTTIGYNNDSKIIEYVVSSGTGSEIKKLSLVESVANQESILGSEVDKLIQTIKHEDSEHKVVFEIGGLEKILHTSTYLASKLYSFERDWEYAQMSARSLESIYSRFKEEVCKRYGVKNLDDSIHIEGLVSEIEQVDKVLSRIAQMHLNRGEVDELDLDVYAESLNNSFRRLQKMAKEIDEEFSARDTSI